MAQNGKNAAYSSKYLKMAKSGLLVKMAQNGQNAAYSKK